MLSQECLVPIAKPSSDEFVHSPMSMRMYDDSHMTSTLNTDAPSHICKTAAVLPTPRDMFSC